jgi:hypothetical protein
LAHPSRLLDFENSISEDYKIQWIIKRYQELADRFINSQLDDWVDNRVKNSVIAGQH